MAYWRMQLHPDDSARSVFHAATSISQGVVGLDFRTEVGDLRQSHVELPDGQGDYRYFESTMNIGDHILIQSHHYPFALVEVSSDYIYVPNAREVMGIWFRHMRFVSNTRYYGDYVTNPLSWQRIPMTDTIARLNDPNGVAFNLIERWLCDV